MWEGGRGENKDWGAEAGIGGKRGLEGGRERRVGSSRVCLGSSVADPGQFGAYPDPRIHASD